MPREGEARLAPTINPMDLHLAGKTAAGQIEKNGYVKTINNLFGFRRSVPTPVQPGPSPLPQPTLFKSTQYGNAIHPVMPTSMPARR